MALDANSSIVTSPIPVIPLTPAFIDYNISQITPYIYVTAADTARQFDKIFSNGIGCVMNVAEELPQLVFPPQSGIESLKFPIQDVPSFPVSNYFDIVADRIDANVKANRRTLLYCHHGRSRSVTFILAYLIKHHRIPLPTAYAMVRERRQLALPNVGFWSQLKSYEERQHQLHIPTPAKHEKVRHHHHHHYIHVHHHLQSPPPPHHHLQSLPPPLPPHPQLVHHHRAHQPVQRNSSNVFQKPPVFRQQFFHKISDGFSQLIKDNPLVTFFSQAIQPSNPKLSRHVSMRRQHPVIVHPMPFSPQFR